MDVNGLVYITQKKPSDFTRKNFRPVFIGCVQQTQQLSERSLLLIYSSKYLYNKLYITRFDCFETHPS